MRHAPIANQLFLANRDRLRRLLPPRSVAIVNANDILPTNADGSLPLHPNSDLFYLSGIEQAESLLLLAPDHSDEKLREVLFLLEPNELLRIWEGHKLSKAEATEISGVKTVKWTGELRSTLHMVMCESEHVFLNTNEHKRASIEVETRDARFIRECQNRYPLHRYQRLAPLLHQLRVVKSAAEMPSADSPKVSG